MQRRSLPLAHLFLVRTGSLSQGTFTKPTQLDRTDSLRLSNVSLTAKVFRNSFWVVRWEGNVAV